MSSSVANKNIFFELLKDALEAGSFVKATLSKPNVSPRWKRVVAGPFTDSQGRLLISFDYSDGVQAERKNYAPAEAYTLLTTMIPDQFKAANVRLKGEEIIFELSDQGSFRLKRKRAEGGDSGPASHNREKNYLVHPSAPFLVNLGIATREGEIRRDMYDKFRQINKFIEIVSSLIAPSDAQTLEHFSVVDFGSGKHYLTFALHQYLASRCKELKVTAVERRPELIALGRQVAGSLGIESLSFQEGAIAESSLESPTLVVALHACDTATDDAIAKAVHSGARYICVAPCCHKYVRARLKPSADLLPILRHGILEERFAESLTDSLRVLALEAAGYQAKLFEFISLEHTAKNVMITAFKTGNANSESVRALKGLKAKFGLDDFCLDRLLFARSQ
jgi:hypothetical protein